jgi:predicted NBD/HSP70 family sugar kinase
VSSAAVPPATAAESGLSILPAVARATPSSATIREHNLQAVLSALQDRRPAARAELADRTALSKPTVGAALRAFERAGLVREYGRTTGRRGPSASLYDLVPEAMLVLGVDIGARHVRFALADLDARPVVEGTLRLPRAHAREVLAAMGEIRKRIGDLHARTELAVVGSPGIIDPASGRVGAAPNIEGWDGTLAEAVLVEALGVPVRVENDVNLAALGEQASGKGREVESFAYLAVGSGLGAGIVLHGELHRGARGASGEVGYLPVGEDPFAPANRARGGPMETRLSSQGLVEAAERLAARFDTAVPRPFDPQGLFEAARTGDPLGRAVVAQTARQMAVCIAGLTAVVDLELVLLGGGIGASGELLLPDIREAVARLVPAPPGIERAGLGELAVRTGAVAVGLTLARQAVLRRLLDGGR